MINIVTPCHGRPLQIMTRYEGRAYMQERVPDEVFCDEPGCYNTWDEHGNADPFNKQPEDENDA